MRTFGSSFELKRDTDCLVRLRTTGLRSESYLVTILSSDAISLLQSNRWNYMNNQLIKPCKRESYKFPKLRA
jgi:putative heme iron utilization protein